MRGPLVVGLVGGTTVACTSQAYSCIEAGASVACISQEYASCCNDESAAVVVGGAPEQLALYRVECRDDESLLCCEAPAYGQSVVANGRLEYDRSEWWLGWSLHDVTLCYEQRSPGGHDR